MTNILNPLALIAEITHRCPLHCVYCSNPLELTSRNEELQTADWLRVFREAAALGVLHLHLTGGEPLARPDLAEMIVGAREARLYTNLITSGIGLSRERLRSWWTPASTTSSSAFRIRRKVRRTGSPELARTRTNSNWRSGFAQHRIAFTVNLVVHRQNIDHLEKMIAALEALRPDRMEIAHAQYYGWALKNRSAIVADPSATRSRADRRRSRRRAHARPRAHRHGHSRLSRALSQSLHGRLGTPVDADRSRWPRAAMPCRGSDSGDAL